MFDSTFDFELDARHLMCPMPVIKTQQAIADLQPGQIIKVICTDPGVKYDIPAWVSVHGHEIIASNNDKLRGADKDSGEIVILIRVGES